MTLAQVTGREGPWVGRDRTDWWPGAEGESPPEQAAPRPGWGPGPRGRECGPAGTPVTQQEPQCALQRLALQPPSPAPLPTCLQVKPR